MPFDLQADLQALQEKRRQVWVDAMSCQAQLDAQIAGSAAETLSTASAKKAAAPQKTVFSSAPVLKTTAEKRAAEEAADTEPEAKRQAVPSPANLRAAAAKAESAEAPAWTFKTDKDGTDVTVTQVNGSGQEASAAKAAAKASKAAASGASAAPIAAAAATAGAAEAAMAMPPPPGPPPGPPLPPGWVRVPHEGDYYYWNTTTNEVSWDHPAGPKAEPEKEVFKEEHRILLSDLGRIIGRQGINLKIIKESIGASINVPRDKGKGKGKGKEGGKDAKGKKGKGKDGKEKAVYGAGDGSVKIPDEQFVTVSISADTAHAARGGKRCLEVMLGYGRRVEGALEALGVEVKYPKLLEDTKSGGPGDKPRDELDPMDPSSYSDAPQGSWSRGMPKFGAGGVKVGDGGGPGPRDSKTANAERF